MDIDTLCTGYLIFGGSLSGCFTIIAVSCFMISKSFLLVTKCPTLLEHKFVLRVQTTPDYSPQEALSNAITDLISERLFSGEQNSKMHLQNSKKEEENDHCCTVISFPQF